MTSDYSQHPVPEEEDAVEAIAIIGMAGRFPGCENIDEFWQHLCAGTELISTFTNDELAAEGYSEDLLSKPNIIKRRGALGRIEYFDAAFFGMSAREAELMDPQHRVFLECAWEALEAGGYAPDKLETRVGVFAGQSMNTYLLSNLLGEIDLVESVESLQASIGNDKDSLTTEVAYRMNLKGPAVTIQSSSSTSLTAVHYACQSILNYECDMALAGGVSIHVPDKGGYLYHEGGTTAKDGHCRTFDAQATGFVAGHGAGVVLLKRLSEAEQAKDHIWAVIRGSAVVNDGADKVSYMAPSVQGQMETIIAAQTVAGVTADQIDYVEAHGTGTLVGDPIEVAALTQAFHESTNRNQYCVLGSVKPNIGHLDAAAGIAGVIKAALVMYHKRIPPTINFSEPNPRIDFANTPFIVKPDLQDWSDKEKIYYAGVSSFGMGGTNAHLILQSPPRVLAESAVDDKHLLLWSAKTETALAAMTARLADYLQANTAVDMSSVETCLREGREEFEFRRCLVCESAAEAVSTLVDGNAQTLFTDYADAGTGAVIFMFPGQGTQYVNMGLDLYQNQPVFKDHLDQCAAILQKSNIDLHALLFADETDISEASGRLKQTENAQLAIFCVSYALAQLWMGRGLQPNAMIGHSIGEYVAACLAGVFSLEDALKLVIIRGQLMQGMVHGAMLSVPMTLIEAEEYLQNDLSIAAINTDTHVVFSGSDRSVNELQELLMAKDIEHSRLHTSHAFHSSALDPMVADFQNAIGDVTICSPRLRYISNLTGTWVSSEDLQSPSYWSRHARETVRFGDGLKELLRDPDAIFLEVGPGKTLSAFLQAQAKTVNGEKPHARRVFASLRHPREPITDAEHWLQTLGKLWLAGVNVTTHEKAEAISKLPLPTYPFERQKYWVEPTHTHSPKRYFTTNSEAKLPVTQWGYIPSWKRAEIDATVQSEQEENAAQQWLIVLNSESRGQKALCERFCAALRSLQNQPIVARFDSNDQQADVNVIHLKAKGRRDFMQLVETLGKQQKFPSNVLYLAGNEGIDLPTEVFEDAFFPLVFLTQALNQVSSSQDCRLLLATQGGWNISGNEQTTAYGPILYSVAQSIRQEYPSFDVRCFDSALESETARHDISNRAVSQIFNAIVEERDDSNRVNTLSAYRGNYRWIPHFEPVALGPPNLSQPKSLLSPKPGGVYLLFGGLGNVGLSLARAISKFGPVTLVFVNRSQFPPESEWNDYLLNSDGDRLIKARIELLSELKEQGNSIELLQADVTSDSEVQTTFEKTIYKNKSIDGIFFTAGSVNESLYRTVDEIQNTDLNELVRTKIQGPAVIAAAIDVLDIKPSFCILISSLASILGGRGMAAYAAANAYLDYFSERQTAESGIDWQSLNFDAFSFDTEFYTRAGNRDTRFAITQNEAIDVFEKLLLTNYWPRLAISTRELNTRMASPDTVTMPANKSASQRPKLRSDFVAARNDLEKEIAVIWQQALALTEVGVYDNFFDLGGNSLIGIKLMAAIKKQWSVELSAVALYESPTVAALAAEISSQTSGADDSTSPSQESAMGQKRGEKRRQQRNKNAIRRND